MVEKAEKWKTPPRIKVLEALGSIADGRIKILKEDGRIEAECKSSEGDKTYKIIFDKKQMAIVSNDNGSMLKGYLGYPSIALLMLKKVLSFDARIAEALKGIPWKKLNEKFKNYFKTEIVVKQIAKKNGIEEKVIDKFVSKVLEEIKRKEIKKLEIGD